MYFCSPNNKNIKKKYEINEKSKNINVFNNNNKNLLFEINKASP